VLSSPIFGGILTVALEAITEPISIVAPSYRVIWTNRATLVGLGADLAQIAGALCYSAYQGRPKRCPDCPLTPVFESGAPHVVEKLFVSETGAVVWREVRAYPVFDSQKVLVAGIRIGFDITSRRRTYDRHIRRIEAVEQALYELSEKACDEADYAVDRIDQSKLTRREKQVLRLLAKGLTNRDIAGILRLSPHTVKSHVKHLCNKLAVSRRSEAAAIAVRLGLI
jgi:DNA-binding CsgD family transcriptional regulator